MKKYLYLALSAVAVFALGSCNKTDKDKENTEPGTDIVITVSPATLTLGVGDVEKLSATVEPAGSNVTIKWSSSDEAVATVSSAGRVTAVAEGKATITASAEGAKAGTCEVTVNGRNAEIVFGDYNIFLIDGIGETPIGDTTIYDGSTPVHCTIGLYDWVWTDENLVYTSGSGYSGAGFLFEAYVPTLVIDDDSYEGGAWNGYLWTGTVYFTNNPVEGMDQVMPVGFDEAKYVGAYSTEDSIESERLYEEAVISPIIMYYDMDEGSYDPFLFGVLNQGLIGNVWIDEETRELGYQLATTWYDGYLGLKVVETEEGLDFADPMQMGDKVEIVYSRNMSDEVAAKHKKLVVNEMPAQLKNRRHISSTVEMYKK